MEKFQLNNGMSVVFAGHSKDYSVCLSVNIGHVNEPSKGIAALFEKTLLLQVKGVIPVFGGTMTAYTTGGEDLEEALEKVAQILILPLSAKNWWNRRKPRLSNRRMIQLR